MLCEICNLNQATIKHHISYFPEITTGVCTSCHHKIHSGLFSGLTKNYIKFKIGDSNAYYATQKRISSYCRKFR